MHFQVLKKNCMVVMAVKGAGGKFEVHVPRVHYAHVIQLSQFIKEAQILMWLFPT